MNFIDDFFKQLSAKANGLPLVVYESGCYHAYLNGKKIQAKIPEIVEDVISQNIPFKLFRQAGELVFIFVIPLTVDNVECKLIIKGNKDYSSTINIISKLTELSYSLSFSENSLTREVELLREELSECEKELSEVYEKYSNLEEILTKKAYEIEGLEESVRILRNSRSKMLKLIDGLNLPLFSVDLNYELLNVNKSVSDFTGEKDLPKFIGSKCFKLVFNNESICEWCRVNDVIEKKKSICQHIKINKDGKELVYEHTMYPIFDENGEVIEIGEYLNDITEQYNLVENLKKSREQIHKISREKIQSINEISSLRAEYNSLLEMYEEAQSKIQKLSIALQKVLEQSTVNEVLKLKSENKNLKSRIDRLENSVENYKKLIDNENSKLSESIVKSVYSLERLINMVDKKKKIEDKDLKNIHDFLNNEVNLLKKYIKSKEESTDGNKSGN